MIGWKGGDEAAPPPASRSPGDRRGRAAGQVRAVLRVPGAGERGGAQLPGVPGGAMTLPHVPPIPELPPGEFTPEVMGRQVFTALVAFTDTIQVLAVTGHDAQAILIALSAHVNRLAEEIQPELDPVAWENLKKAVAGTTDQLQKKRIYLAHL